MLARALLTAAAIAVAAPALAQTATQPTEGRALLRACGPDIQNFCSGVSPGGGRIIGCLRPHVRQLSPECKGQMVEAHARHKQQMQQQQPQ